MTKRVQTTDQYVPGTCGLCGLPELSGEDIKLISRAMREGLFPNWYTREANTLARERQFELMKLLEDFASH